MLYLKHTPSVMIKYKMNFDFQGLLGKCVDPNYTVYDFLMDCKFVIKIINGDMSRQEITSNWTFPGENDRLDINDLLLWFWGVQFQNYEEFQMKMRQYKMIDVFEFFTKHFGKDYWTTTFSTSSRGNPYIVKIS